MGEPERDVETFDCPHGARLPPEEGEDWAGVKPTMWQRIKAYMGQGMVNRVVEKYVTPEGLPQLFNYRKMYRDKAATAPTDEIYNH